MEMVEVKLCFLFHNIAERMFGLPLENRLRHHIERRRTRYSSPLSGSSISSVIRSFRPTFPTDLCPHRFVGAGVIPSILPPFSSSSLSSLQMESESCRGDNPDHGQKSNASWESLFAQRVILFNLSAVYITFQFCDGLLVSGTRGQEEGRNASCCKRSRVHEGFGAL